MGDEGLRIDRDERGVVTLTLDRPEVRNALSPELMSALADAIDRLSDDDSVRALVLTGAGSAFCAGADINWMSAMVGYGFDENVADSRRIEAMVKALDRFPAPTVARVNGHAFGGAAGLIGAVDIAVAARGSLLAFSETRLGIAPAMISAYVQPRIGVSNARRYFLTGERFDADRARDIGLVHEVCDPGELDATCERIVAELLAAGPVAQREAKRLITTVAAADGPEQTEDVRAELIARLRVSDEGQEGMHAFLDKRRPSWIPEA